MTTTNDEVVPGWVLGAGALLFGGIVVAAAVAGGRERGSADAVKRAIDPEMTREALERYPRFGAKLPHHDFSKPDLHDIGVSRVNESQVRRRSQAPNCAEVYEGYVPIDRLRPVLAEQSVETDERECLDCGYVGDRKEFKFGVCPQCESERTQRLEPPQYDWESFSPRATFPVAEVFISHVGDTLVTDGNHRVTYWQEQGMTHAPAWVIDERPCAQKKPHKSRKMSGGHLNALRSHVVRVLDRKDTGNYRVEFVDLGDTGEEFVLRVRYTGAWAGGDAVDVHVRDLDAYLQDYVDEGDLERIDAAAKKWFGRYILGDHDVERYLDLDGYDQHTNRRR
jgi:hypothetical protein